MPNTFYNVVTLQSTGTNICTPPPGIPQQGRSKVAYANQGSETVGNINNEQSNGRAGDLSLAPAVFWGDR